jgi:hypothetical protein
VGDIKSSQKPRYYQKWQVAFYARLLQSLIEQTPALAHLSVADTGFLLTPSGTTKLALRQCFALKPYFSSANALFHTIRTTLAAPPAQAFWQLQDHCVNCADFTFCYQQAINEEDIQFLPGIRRGELEKMRRNDITSLQQADDLEKIFSGERKKSLQRAMHALQHNIIIIKGGSKTVTLLFPANITSIFCIHPAVDPVTGRVVTISLLSVTGSDKRETLSWFAGPDSGQQDMWHEFSGYLARQWQDNISNGQGPHVVLLHSTARRQLLHLAESMDDLQMKTLFSRGENSHCTELQQVMEQHFFLPVPGILTLYDLHQILALIPEAKLPVPESCCHSDRFIEMETGTICALLLQLWQWISTHLKSGRHQDSRQLIAQTRIGPAAVCREFIEAERLHREQDIAALTQLSLAERIERFRAMSPLEVIGTGLDEEGKFLHLFAPTDLAATEHACSPKFRAGDFLRLVPLGVSDLQSGIPVIMAESMSDAGEIALYLRQNNMAISSGVSWSLEEDGEDFLSAKLLDAVQHGFSSDNLLINGLFAGALTNKKIYNEKQLHSWLQSEAAAAHLNVSQQQALKSVFEYQLSLIIGPPGTGKTHLLAWILIALIRDAQADGTPLRIAVSALTHKAIDQVLCKLVTLVNRHALTVFPARCYKWGSSYGARVDPEDGEMQVELCENAAELLSRPYVIVGGTGFGFSAMLSKQKGPAIEQPFDWVIFDESSQLLVPQALLSLLHGKGNFLFLGDTCQLPPIIRSPVFTGEQEEEGESFAAEIRSSVLEILLKRYPRQSRQLEVTYRMNDEICRFPSQTWYRGRLHPAPENARSRLSLPSSRHDDFLAEIINPSQPVALVGIQHQGCTQESAAEAELLVSLSCRLLQDHKVTPEQLAIITPHRAQNNAISRRLARQSSHENLPMIDTVERMQGAEQDVILFGFTCSDPDLIFSEFLNNPNRFNVVLTRARHKLIIIGSPLLFNAVAQTEKQLQANSCFKDFVTYCRHNGWYFEYKR